MSICLGISYTILETRRGQKQGTKISPFHPCFFLCAPPHLKHADSGLPPEGTWVLRSTGLSDLWDITVRIKVLFGEGFKFYKLLSHILLPSSFRRKGPGRWVPTVQVKKLTSEGEAISVGMGGRDSNPGPDWRRGRGYAFAHRGRGYSHIQPWP